MYDAVLYQVFPDRFARSAQADDHATAGLGDRRELGGSVDVVAPGRSQQFYGGDLDGVTGKLDHSSSSE
jgi:alpha-glucosidase